MISFSRIFFSAQDDSFIDWDAHKKLIWDDFRQSPDPGSPNAALTSAVIKYDFAFSSTEGLKFHIRCQFDKNKSWGRVKTDYILTHEQGHFDIAEIFTRKLNKAFKEYTPTSNLKQDIYKIYGEVMHQFHEVQEQYDRETNFSINHPQQVEWSRKITQQLDDLKPYADYH
jgi:hypothetical protein